jgi:hypothetical protein
VGTGGLPGQHCRELLIDRTGQYLPVKKMQCQPSLSPKRRNSITDAGKHAGI